MAISPLKMLWFSDLHDLQDIFHLPSLKRANTIERIQRDALLITMRLFPECDYEEPNKCKG